MHFLPFYIHLVHFIPLHFYFRSFPFIVSHFPSFPLISSIPTRRPYVLWVFLRVCLHAFIYCLFPFMSVNIFAFSSIYAICLHFHVFLFRRTFFHFISVHFIPLRFQSISIHFLSCSKISHHFLAFPCSSDGFRIRVCSFCFILMYSSHFQTSIPWSQLISFHALPFLRSTFDFPISSHYISFHFFSFHLISIQKRSYSL